ncbi:hypothetical protein F5882DRAFT_49384 [Hyaloscypha sp. PMI_1271]|nr:hypothetical protein F5882DRAFT_49384 [Hyaloscypha sp. PMI_1271]
MLNSISPTMIVLSLLFLFPFLFVAPIVAANSSSPPTVKVLNGSCYGASNVWSTYVSRYPYSLPPVEDLRFWQAASSASKHYLERNMKYYSILPRMHRLWE